jgi:hypothetical protein
MTLNPRKVQRLREGLEGGVSVSGMAKDLGIAPSTVFMCINEFREVERILRELKERMRRVSQILKDSSLTDEQKKVFIGRPIEPLDTWKLSKTKNGNGMNESNHNNPKGKQMKTDSLSRIMEKYGLVKDDMGIKIGKYVECWRELTVGLEKEGYSWNRDSKHFVKSSF